MVYPLTSFHFMRLMRVLLAAAGCCWLLLAARWLACLLHVGERLAGHLLAAAAGLGAALGVRLLHAKAAPPLLKIVQVSKSASARFEALLALSTLALNSEEALQRLALARDSRCSASYVKATFR